MASAPLSVGTRRAVRIAGWAAFFMCLAVFAVGRNLGTFGGFVVAQVGFAAILALAATACLLVYLRVRQANSFEALLWAMLSLALGFVFAAEVYYSGYQIAVNIAGPKQPSLFEVLSALAAIAYVALISSMSRLRILPLVTRSRLIAGMAGQMVLIFAVLLWGVARPMAAGVPHSFIDPILWVAYMCVGITVLVGTFSDVLGVKIARWSGWETLIASSLVFLGVALILWPFWSRAAATGGAAARYHVLSVLLAVSYGFAFMGALYRLTSLESQWRAGPLPPPSPPKTVGSRVMVSTLQALAIPVLGFMLYLQPTGSEDQGLLLVLITCVTLALVTRTAFLSAETLQARVRTARDPLTGALRRSYFIEQLAMAVDEARARSQSLSVAVLDVDDFAKTNVIEGHAVGDSILARLGEALRSSFGRHGELVGRLGGDEFALCLPDVDLYSAINRLREQRPALNASASTEKAPITVSVGVAAFPTQVSDAEALLKAADGALYWAKYGGKDRVIAYSDAVMQALDAEARLREIDHNSRLEVVRALAAATDARDPATSYHSRNVATLVALLSAAMKLDSEKATALQLAAAVHDVGKIAVPDAVLRKRGPLSSAERTLFEQHAVTGERIVESTELREIAGWLRSHHERWDGRGYPDGLQGEGIPIESRVIAVCDAYDVMVSGGPERPAISRMAALQEIDQGMGALFDPAVAEAFIQAVAAQPSLGWAEQWVQ